MVNFESSLAQFNRNIRVIKRIPKSVRITGAYEQARLIDVCVMYNELGEIYFALQIERFKSQLEN